MSTADFQQAGGSGLSTAQARNAEFHFTGAVKATSVAPPLKLTFEAIDLSQARPRRIRIEHFAGGDNPSFDAPMTLIYFLGGEEISLNFAKPGLRILWGEELLDIFIKPKLVFLDRKHVVAGLFCNLRRQPFLSVQGVCGDHFSRNFNHF